CLAPLAKSQTCATAPAVVTAHAPSGLNVMSLNFSRTRASSTPELASQTRTVQSSETVTTRSPSELKSAQLTGPSWAKRASSTPLLASQTRAVLSREAVTTRIPSELKAAAKTAPSWASPASSAPLATSQTRAVPSPTPGAVTSSAPSG